MIVTLASRERFQQAPSSDASNNRVWLVGYLVLIVVIFDIIGYTIGEATGRYLLVLAPLYLVLVLRTRDHPLRLRGFAAHDRFLFLLFSFGLAGSLYGLLFRSPESPALAMFVPMALGFMHLTCGASTTSSATAERQCRRLLWLGMVYLALHAGTETGVLPAFSPGTHGPTDVAVAVFRHEKAFLVAMALAVPWVLGKRLAFFIAAVLSTALFLSYPAATYLLVALVACMTLVATSRASSQGVRWAIAAMGLVLVVVAAVQVSADGDDPDSVRSAYFASVGKSDNNHTRTDLWRQAVDEIAASPVVGSAFTGDITLRVDLSGRDHPVPPHNDLLQIGMGGGLVAIGLLVGWVVATNVAAMRKWKLAEASGRSGSAAMVRVLLVALNSFFAVAMFNPVMVKVGLLAAAMIFYTWLWTIDAGSSEVDKRVSKVFAAETASWPART